MDMSKFEANTLSRINIADDLHIAPFRADGKTYGSPTWIWEVAVEGNLYVRAYNGTSSRWYQSAVAQKAGKIEAAGEEFKVKFEPQKNEELLDKIDEAYREKYHGSPYLKAMISNRAKSATILIHPI